jgi:hypothetical protein
VAVFIPRDETAAGAEVGGLWKNAFAVGVASGTASQTDAEVFFWVQLRDLPQQIRVPRICVCFAHEDRANFVNRHFDASQRRENAEAMLKYFLYVQCMPSDSQQISSLTDEQIDRILRKTTANVKSKLSMGGVGEAAVMLINEATKEYELVQNLLIFDACMAAASTEELTALDLTQPVMTPPFPVPANALVACPDFDFMCSFENFVAEVLLANFCVIPSLVKVRFYL